jgi:hypothetical protein
MNAIEKTQESVGIFAVVMSAALVFAPAAAAQQVFTATVDGKPFESDHDGITVVPVTTGNTVTITARSKGFGAYPAPKGHANRRRSFALCPKRHKNLRLKAPAALARCAGWSLGAA